MAQKHSTTQLTLIFVSSAVLLVVLIAFIYVGAFMLVQLPGFRAAPPPQPVSTIAHATNQPAAYNPPTLQPLTSAPKSSASTSSQTTPSDAGAKPTAIKPLPNIKVATKKIHAKDS